MLYRFSAERGRGIPQSILLPTSSLAHPSTLEFKSRVRQSSLSMKVVGHGSTRAWSQVFFLPFFLSAGGEPGFIEFHSNIPLTCPPKKKKKPKAKGNGKERSKRKDEEEGGEEDSDSCCINLEVSTRGGSTPRCPDGNQFDLVNSTTWHNRSTG